MRACGALLADGDGRAMMASTYSLNGLTMMADPPPRVSPQAEPRPASGESTVDLLGRIQSGDADALDLLYLRYLAPLRRWARGRLPRWARDLRDTEDLVQDTLLHTLRHVESFDYRGAGALQAYLRQAVVNRVRDEVRRIGRRPDVTSIEEAIVSEGPSPLEEAVGTETLARYDAALSRLTPGEREAVVARVEMGSTYLEIAEALGKPSADAARMAVGRALIRLAEEMHREG
jgi:RNA polymerase sigma-70 factor, ECF subfamily